VGEKARAGEFLRSAKADFELGVVRITAEEYETALAVAAGHTARTG